MHIEWVYYEMNKIVIVTVGRRFEVDEMRLQYTHEQIYILKESILSSSSMQNG